MDIETKLKYLQWQDDYTHTRPYRVAQFGSNKKSSESPKKHNLVFKDGDCAEIIRDIRAREKSMFTLETTGFVYSRCPPPLFTSAKDFCHPDHIKDLFLPQCEEILRKEIEEVEQVFVFDWKVSFPITMFEQNRD